MSIPDPSTTEWVPIWNPTSQGPVGPAGPAGSPGVPGADGTPRDIADEGTTLARRTVLNFVGAGVTASDDGTKIVVTIPGGGSGQNQTPWLSHIDANTFALNNASGVNIKGTSWPTYSIQHGTTLAKARLLMAVAGSRLDLNTNLNFNGTDWVRDDIALPAALYSQINGGHSFYYCPAGANPATTAVKQVAIVGSNGINVTGDVDVTGAYKVNGVPISTGTGQNQTPWLSNIDASGKSLSNALSLGMMAQRAFALNDTAKVMLWGSGGAAVPAWDYGSIIMRPNPTTGDGGGAHFEMYVGSGASTSTAASMFLQAVNPGGATPHCTSLSLFADASYLVSVTAVAYPVLGQMKGAINIGGNSNIWGLQIGGYTDGTSWMQAQRTDGNATAYPLAINPMGGNVVIGGTSAEGKLTVEGDIFIRNGNCLQMRPAANGWNMYLQATGLQLDVCSGGAPGVAIASFVHGGAVIVPGTFRCGSVNDKLSVTSQTLGADYQTAAVRVNETAGANGWGGTPRISFYWGANAIAAQIALGADTTITCLDWQAGGYANFRALNIYATGGISAPGNVQAGTFNSFTVAGTNTGANRICATDGNGWLNVGYINTAINPEGITPVEFYVANGSDAFIRKVSAQTAANKIFSSPGPAPGFDVHTAATGGFVTGRSSRGVNDYGALYWVDSPDRALWLYHSGYPGGFAIKICAQGMFFLGIDAVQGQAGTGKVYKAGNNLCVS